MEIIIKYTEMALSMAIRFETRISRVSEIMYLGFG